MFLVHNKMLVTENSYKCYPTKKGSNTLYVVGWVIIYAIWVLFRKHVAVIILNNIFVNF